MSCFVFVELGTPCPFGSHYGHYLCWTLGPLQVFVLGKEARKVGAEGKKVDFQWTAGSLLLCSQHHLPLTVVEQAYCRLALQWQCLDSSVAD